MQLGMFSNERSQIKTCQTCRLLMKMTFHLLNLSTQGQGGGRAGDKTGAYPATSSSSTFVWVHAVGRNYSEIRKVNTSHMRCKNSILYYPYLSSSNLLHDYVLR